MATIHSSGSEQEVVEMDKKCSQNDDKESEEDIDWLYREYEYEYEYDNWV